MFLSAAGTSLSQSGMLQNLTRVWDSVGSILYIIMLSVAVRCTPHAEKQGHEKELAGGNISGALTDF